MSGKPAPKSNTRREKDFQCLQLCMSLKRWWDHANGSVDVHDKNEKKPEEFQKSFYSYVVALKRCITVGWIWLFDCEEDNISTIHLVFSF